MKEGFKMTTENAMQDRIASIITRLRTYSDHYYNTDQPLVSDEEYDRLYATLQRLSPGNPFFSEVGAPPRSGYKVKREIPMGTLRKIYKKEGLVDYLTSQPECSLLACPKYDGFGVELVYNEEGRLVSASTRGDGYEGDSVLEAMSCIVPMQDDKLCNVTVRGEAIIPKSHFPMVEALGYKAMRNAVPGIVRSARRDALQYVHFIAYEFMDGSDSRIEQRENYYRLFNIEAHKIYKRMDIKGLEEYHTHAYEDRDNFEYEIDGIVIKTDLIDSSDDFLHPRQMVAYKFKSNREITTLRDIEYQLGATGKFTPVGVFDEVEFQGATLTRASFGSISRLNSFEFTPSVGSTIEVSRRGDIIPYIEDVVDTVEGMEFGQLEYCPYCYSELEIRDSGEPFCVNPECPEMLRLKVTQYVTSIGAKGIGQSLITALIDQGMVVELPDLYRINPDDISRIPGFGQAAVEKFRAFQEKQVTPLEFLCAYPFEGLGKAVWTEVLKKYDLNGLVYDGRSHQDFVGMKGLGGGKIDSLVSQLAEHRYTIIKILAISTVVTPS